MYVLYIGNMKRYNESVRIHIYFSLNFSEKLNGHKKGYTGCSMRQLQQVNKVSSYRSYTAIKLNSQTITDKDNQMVYYVNNSKDTQSDDNASRGPLVQVS